MANSQWLTVNQYADKFQKHPQYVRDMCKEGRIKAEKVGQQWRIPYCEPVDVQADEMVIQAVQNIVKPCVKVVDSAIVSLVQLKEELLRIPEEK